MAYEAPYIDESGLHISSYPDILASLIDAMKQIFGSDIYLANDSQDYQLISAFALMVYDTQQALLLAYNNNSPTSAIGVGLDRIVALNGIRRTKASYSTCLVKLTGIPGTVINNAMVQDDRGTQWKLPEAVTLEESGLAEAIATCQTIGHITATPGDIHSIVTPTRGWTAVTNTVSAIPGVNQETDSALRAKQKISTANPSKTVFEGTIGAIANAEGVVRYAAYENDTSVEKDGQPPHSITLVIEGGEDQALAELIYRHKTPGCYTHGDVVVEIDNAHGILTPIRFYRPHYVELETTITVKPLSGYTDAITSQIQENVHSHINGLAIGESLYSANLNVPVLQALGNPPGFYVLALKVNKVGEAVAEVIEVAKMEALSISLDQITIEVEN